MVRHCVVGAELEYLISIVGRQGLQSASAQGSPEPSSLRGSSLHWVPEQLKLKAITGACKLIDGCSLVLCSATVSVVLAGICQRNEVNSIA